MRAMATSARGHDDADLQVHASFEERKVITKQKAHLAGSACGGAQRQLVAGREREGRDALEGPFRDHGLRSLRLGPYGSKTQRAPLGSPTKMSTEEKVSKRSRLLTSGRPATNRRQV